MSGDKYRDKEHRVVEPHGTCPTTGQYYHAIRRLYPTTVKMWGREVGTFGERITCSSCGQLIADFKRDPRVTYA